MSDAFTRLVSPGVGPWGRLFVEIRYGPSSSDEMRLSITGVEGPKRNGDCWGSCGQCIEALDRLEIHPDSWAPGWAPAIVAKLRDIWERWHLNDMRAGTPAQSAWLREHGDKFPGYPVNHYEWAKAALAAVGLQPDGDYSYGSAWLYEEVPADVVDWLRALPETTYAYPWGFDRGAS